jgi:Amt family ammonium transporter
MIFTLVLVGFGYPVTGHWIWGGGWLAKLGMWDFAGSTVVHSVGGWAGLAGILVLGPRLGKYKADGTVQPIPGHSMAWVFIGALVLWLGWFGFNPGSTMAVNPVAIAHVAMTTNMACVAAIVSSTVMAWIMLGKPDFSMTVNGALAGLVAITAPCAFVSVGSSLIIGLIGGILVVPAVILFDKLRIDDPVGALSVHLVNGIWGTIAVGLFATTAAPGGGPDGLFSGGGMTSLIAQLTGVAAVGAFTFVLSFVAWYIIKVTVGLRVTPEDEVRGLDLSEMGMEAYSGDSMHR